MVEKLYAWADGAVLDDHSRRKHKILREYLFQYLTVRCQLPMQSRFRLAVVDGFAGAGTYKCGASGSPLIVLEELRRASDAINIQRATQGLGGLEIECLLVLNDAEEGVVELLKARVEPLLAEIRETAPRLHVRVEYLSQSFESAYPEIKALLEQGRYRSLLFNLDQCGHSLVTRTTLIDIMRSNPSVEIFYTFAIESLVSFLRKTDPTMLARQLAHLHLDPADLNALEEAMSRSAWLGAAERLVFEAFRACAPYVSPFSINNPLGWRYWLIHFANVPRARQVYNNILHENASAQAHFGRSGLNMLAYDPSHETASLYLFDQTGREAALAQLLEDIPRFISEHGDVIPVGDFYGSIYNATPAHADDIHRAMIDNPDIEVVTESGGGRRSARTITGTDLLKLKRQTSFFPMFQKPPSRS
ncbi:MAG: three-Cys-motif partner protein TcmP [Alphaproteobacteria bacterium]|nr:three-Cys-motif partner protein TcmP [Alphaproteobacteria bacterium]